MNDRQSTTQVVACLDTNVLISALLSSKSTAVPTRIVQHLLAGHFSVVIAEPTIDELRTKVGTKSYLVNRISPESVDDMIVLLRNTAEIVPTEGLEIQPLTRDPRDDYLLAPAIRARVDYVVSGDKDLLVQGTVECVRILSPADFLHLLDSAASP